MTVALWMLLWLAGAQFPAGSVQGVVLRAGTSQPLVGEVVGLWPTARTAKTDRDGRFKFENVEAGEYSLTVIHDGIKFQTPISLTAARRNAEATLEVKPAPSIAGTIFDPNGERAAATRVQAFRTVYTPNGPRLRSVMSVMTDDLGDFRLYWLRPGEYYVSASYSDRDEKIGAAGLRLTSNLSKRDDDFPSIFFGGEYSPSLSQKVRLGRDADSDGVRIFLKDGPKFNLVIHLYASGQPACARVAVVPEGGIVSDQDFVTEACDTLTVRGLSPGTYSVLAVGEQIASDVYRVSVGSSNPRDLDVLLVTAVTITGRVSPPPSRIRLARNTMDVSQEFEALVERDGSFMFPDIGPGAYDVSVDGLPEDSYVSSIRYNGSDALNRPFRVDSGTPGRLDIQIARSNLVAEGLAVDRSLRPVPGAMVVLVPRVIRGSRQDRYLTAIADGGANFRIPGIPPGDYVAFAFEDLEPGAYYAFSYTFGLLARYLSSGQAFNSSSAGPLRLFAVPASQTAGGLR